MSDKSLNRDLRRLRAIKKAFEPLSTVVTGPLPAARKRLLVPDDAFFCVLYEDDSVQHTRYMVLPAYTDITAMPSMTLACWMVRDTRRRSVNPVAVVLRQGAGLPLPEGVECDMLIGPLPKQSRRKPAKRAPR